MNTIDWLSGNLGNQVWKFLQSYRNAKIQIEGKFGTHPTGNFDVPTETDLVLSPYVPDPGADLDLDSDVDGIDFLAWQQGESPIPLSSTDLAVWQADFGVVASAITAASTGVPEPGSLALLGIGLASLVMRRRRSS